MWYYNHYMKAPPRDTPGKVVEIARDELKRRGSVTSRPAGADVEDDLKYPPRVDTGSGSGSGSGSGTSSASRVGVGCGTAVLGLVVVTVWASSGTPDPQLNGLSASRRLLDTSCATIHLSQAVQTTGTVLGWVSAVIYLNSRLPQVYKNYKAKSVEGLSALMFFCAVMGNLTYAAGVLIKASGWDDVNAAMPWLVGSVGTIIFDFIIVIQCFCYRNA